MSIVVPVIEAHTIISNLEEKLAEQANAFSEISRIGTVITSLLDLERILPSVMESALAITKAEAGEIALFDSADNSRPSISWGISDKIINQLRDKTGVTLWENIKQWDIPIKVDYLPDDDQWHLGTHEVNIISFLAVPMKSQSRTVGAIVVANKTDNPNFDNEDLFSLSMLGCFAAVAVENSRLHAEAIARERLETELEMARHIQKTLMPKKIVDLGRLSVVTHNQMAMEVGGDFYDIIELSPEKCILVVADVSSKGLPAALLMTSTRSLVRAFADEPIDLSKLAKNVNIQLSRDSEELRGMFVTAIMVYIDFGAKIIKSLNAGHPPGFMYYPDGTIKELKTGGAFLGQFDDLKFKEETLPLIPGSRLFLYTDGAFECTDFQGKMLGLKQLRRFFADHCQSASVAFIESLLKLLELYSVDPTSVDDTTFLLADVR
jgi:serine phosphatase RsbU (regulator of sigma subunit)